MWRRCNDSNNQDADGHFNFWKHEILCCDYLRALPRPLVAALVLLATTESLSFMLRGALRRRLGGEGSSSEVSSGNTMTSCGDLGLPDTTRAMMVCTAAGITRLSACPKGDHGSVAIRSSNARGTACDCTCVRMSSGKSSQCSVSLSILNGIDCCSQLYATFSIALVESETKAHHKLHLEHELTALGALSLRFER